MPTAETHSAQPWQHSSEKAQRPSDQNDMNPSASFGGSVFTRRPRKLNTALTTLLIALLVCVWGTGFVDSHATNWLSFPVTPRALNATEAARASSVESTEGPLTVVQVYPPVRFDQQPGSNASSCQQVLAIHSFGFSYGKPFIGPYNPPSCSFNRVAWNLTVTSAGRQFDRLGTVWLDDVEVFRTSTAEPTQSGIVWTYIKDMSAYMSLFKQDHTLVFDLGNLINDIYTGAFNVTLTATYYNVKGNSAAADVIMPLSRGLTNASSAFSYPSQNVTSALTVPKNSTKAIFTIAATGQADEEFWWSNVLQQDVNDFPADGTLLGYSPFREVQLFVDGQLAGVVWPFPIIFTGGVVPGLWRPLVGIDVFDLKEDEIDVTAWLPYLADGKEHVFSIKVSGLMPTGDGSSTLSETVDNNWVVSGKLFLWTDADVAQVAGPAPRLTLPQPVINATSQFTNASNPNATSLDYQVNVSRQLAVIGTNQTSWTQSLQFACQSRLSSGGNVQYSYLHISGHDASSSGYSRTVSYPLNATTLTTTDGDMYTIGASISRGQTIQIFGPSVFPTGLETYISAIGNQSNCGSLLDTTQTGQATYIANTTAKTSLSYGETDQRFTFSAISSSNQPTVHLYYRDIQATNGTFTLDNITDDGNESHAEAGRMSTWADMQDFALVGQKSELWHDD